MKVYFSVRLRCPGCGRSIRVNTDGMFRPHNKAKGKRCPYSGLTRRHRVSQDEDAVKTVIDIPPHFEDNEGLSGVTELCAFVEGYSAFEPTTQQVA